MKTVLSALVLLASYHAFAFEEAEEADWPAEAPVFLVHGYNMNPKFNDYNSRMGAAPDNTAWSSCTRKQFSLVEVAGWTPVARGWRNPQYQFRQSGAGW